MSYLGSRVNGPALNPDHRGLPLCGHQVYYIFRKWCRVVGLEAHPHMLWHSQATRLMGKGVPTVVVQKRMGHTNIATTSRYGHAGLRQQVEALAMHPLNRR